MEEKDSYRLFEMSLSLYSKYGIRSVTMEDVSRELGVSKKTIYQHVSDKKELVKRVIEHEIGKTDKLVEQINDSTRNAIDELIEINKQLHAVINSHSPIFYYDLKKYYPDLFRQWIMRRRMLMAGMILRNLINGKNEGLYRSEMDEAIISRLYMARMEMLQDNELINSEDFISLQFSREIFLYHLHGICNNKGLKYLSQHQEIV